MSVPEESFSLSLVSIQEGGLWSSILLAPEGEFDREHAPRPVGCGRPHPPIHATVPPSCASRTPGSEHSAWLPIREPTRRSITTWVITRSHSRCRMFSTRRITPAPASMATSICCRATRACSPRPPGCTFNETRGPRVLEARLRRRAGRVRIRTGAARRGGAAIRPRDGRPLPAPGLLQPTLDAKLAPFSPRYGRDLGGTLRRLMCPDVPPGLVRAWMTRSRGST
jgi:hypothetical protein